MSTRTIATAREGAAAGGGSWAPLLLQVGGWVLRYSLVLFLVLFGALKWTSKEAQDIEALVVHSPLLFWTYGLFGTQGGAELIGVIELSIGALIAARPWLPRASAFGSLGAALMFLTTLSCLFTTPDVGESAGFLMKDLTLLGAALWTAGEALSATNGPAAPSREL